MVRRFFIISSPKRILICACFSELTAIFFKCWWWNDDPLCTALVDCCVATKLPDDYYRSCCGLYHFIDWEEIKILGRVGILARLRVIDLIFSLEAQVSNSSVPSLRPPGRPCIHNGVKYPMQNHWKCPFLSTKLSKYRITCSKLAGELANRSTL